MSGCAGAMAMILPALFLLDGDGLLVRGLQLVRRLRSCAQALDGVHHVGLLGQNGVAEILRPIELVAHHRQHRRRSNQGFHAIVPSLLVDGGFELVALETLIGAEPTIGLDDFERISRRHQDLGKQCIRVERDRRHELIKLVGSEKVLVGCLRGRARSRCGLGRRGLRRRRRLRIHRKRPHTQHGGQQNRTGKLCHALPLGHSSLNRYYDALWRI